MEKPAIPDPSTVWETSMVTKEQIQSLVNCGLLQPKSQVGWRPTAGEVFPTEGTSETVVFIAHIKRGFGVPAGDFLRGLLQFFRIELMHLAPNSSQSSQPSSTSARPTSASLLTSTSGASSSS
jgi:hypothetical protein